MKKLKQILQDIKDIVSLRRKISHEAKSNTDLILSKTIKTDIQKIINEGGFMSDIQEYINKL